MFKIFAILTNLLNSFQSRYLIFLLYLTTAYFFDTKCTQCSIFVTLLTSSIFYLYDQPFTTTCFSYHHGRQKATIVLSSPQKKVCGLLRQTVQSTLVAFHELSFPLVAIAVIPLDVIFWTLLFSSMQAGLKHWLYSDMFVWWWKGSQTCSQINRARWARNEMNLGLLKMISFQ